MKKLYNQLRTIKRLLTLLILPFLLEGVANGQTITIGSGTASNSYIGYPAPFGNYYSGARHQFIYRKAELQAAGGVNGVISQFGFNVTATNGVAALAGYTVKMGQTATNTLTAFQTNLTTVFSPASYQAVTGWNMHTLSTPFPLDTSLNLVVEVCFFNGVNTYTYNASTQWTTGLPANTTIFNRDDVAGSGCPSTGNNSTTNNTSRPNARLVITQGTPMTYSTAFLTQNNTFPIQTAKSNHEIMRIAVVTTGISNPLSITQFDLATNGTSNAADITRARIYSTGNSKVFDTTTLFGSISNPGFSPYVITGSKALGSDTSYFWLTYDINPSAFVGSIFDAEVSSITVGGTTQYLTSTSATGSRTILSPLAGTYQVGTGQTYTRLENAIADVYYRGISGDVEFVLNNSSDTLYNTLEIQEFTNPSNNKLTIRPATNGLITGNVAGPLIRISASNVVIDGSNSAFTSTRNLTITNTNATGPQVISINSSGTKVISNCSVLNTNIINGAAVSSALVLQDIGGTLGGYYQNILIKNNSIQKAYIGAYIFCAGSATNMNIVVDSNDVNATGVNQNRLVGIYMQGVIGGHIGKNNVGNFNTTNAEVKAGIWLATGAQNIVIERNRISNVGVTTTTSAGHGIRISTGLTNAGISIRNNIIDSIYGGGTTTFHSTSNPAGITLSSTQSGIQIAYNTIKMGGNTLAASAANSAGIRILTGSTADVRNNYINNTLGLSGATGTGTYGIAIETSTAQLSIINTNNYYANASGTGVKAIGRIAGTDYLTLSSWKGAVIADAGSVSENTPFVSASDLHIPTNTASQMESAGTVVAGIDGDYDLDTRSATTPDIGADEFTGIVADLTAPAISYTLLSNNSSVTSRAVTNVTITDGTGVNVSFGSAPRIYYKKPAHANVFGGNGSSDNGWKYAETSNTSSPYSFNIDYSILFGGTVSATDTIQYFIVAQDYAAAVNTGANPSTGFGGTSVSTITSAPTTPNFYIITPAPLAGPYQVGAGQQYTTLTAAVNDLNLRGVSAAVTFNLADATYSTNETFPIVIKKVDGTSATNTVTIKPATGINSVITGSNSSSLIRMEEASYITINGSNNATTTMNLTIKNTSTSGSVIHISSLGTSRGCTNDAILNTTIAGNSVSSTSVYGIFIGSTLGSSGNDNSNITISNDSIYYVGKGIYSLGANAVAGLNISNNKIGNSVIGNSIYNSGIEIDNATSPVVTKNNIVNIKSTTTDLSGPVAIRLSNTSNAAVSKNKITGVAYTGTSGYGAKGIDAVTGNTNAAITNNFVADISSDGDGSDIIAYNNFGIVLRTGSGHSVRNNSIWIAGNRASNTYTNAISAGIFVGASISNADVRNNLVLNTQTSSNSSAGANYGVYSLAAASAFTFLNYNNYFVSSATAAVTKATGYIGSADQLTLANWKSATGLENNSASDSIQFTSLSDLHLTGTSRGNTHFIATPLAAIPTDIDDETRNALYPYMGADENVSFPLPVELTRFAANRKNTESSLLTWATASESNNSHFIIERSADSKSFTGIGSVKGKGNSKAVTNYTFTDETAADFAKSANGIVYYRLTQVDLDGKATYSKVASVLFSNELSGVVVYPNPVVNNLTIANTGIESGVVQIIITDIQGRELVNRSIEMSTTVNKQLVDMSDFEGGIYFVKTILNGKVSNYKVLRAN